MGGSEVVIPADFSGDKLSDVFLMTASGKWTVATFTSKGPKFKGGQWAAGWSGWRADFNTDLLADLLLYNPKNGKYRVVLRKGTTFTILKGAWNRKLQVECHRSQWRWAIGRRRLRRRVGLVGHCHGSRQGWRFRLSWRHI